MKQLNFSLVWFCPLSSKATGWVHFEMTSLGGLCGLRITSFWGDPLCLDAFFPISILMRAARCLCERARCPAMYFEYIELFPLEETEPVEDRSTCLWRTQVQPGLGSISSKKTKPNLFSKLCQQGPDTSH